MSSPDGTIGQSETCPACGTVTIVPRPIPTVATPMTEESGEFRPIMTVARERGNRARRLGVAGIVVGAIACLTLWAPVPFLHTALIGAAGLVSVCVGFVSARRPGGNIAMPFVGCVICAVAIYFSLFHSGDAVEAPQPADAPAKSAAAPPKKLAPGAPLPIGMARQWDDRSLKVLAVKVDRVPLRSVTGDSRSEDKFLMVTIEASNTSESEDRRFIYMTLRGIPAARDRTYASLSDSKGRFYKRVDFGLDTHPAGGVARSAPLTPGDSVRDILIFERPAGSEGPYRLELPLGNLGGTGLAGWEIPESALR